MRPDGGRSCSAAAMAARSRARCGSIRRAIARPMSATSRCCWRGSRRPSWRATAPPARTPRARPAPASIVMDDGFQNPGAAQGPLDPGGGWPPRHRQRQGVSGRSAAGAAAEPSFAAPHAVLVVGAGAAGERGRGGGAGARLPVFHGRLEPDAAGARGAQGPAGAGLRRHRRSGKVLRDAARRRDRRPARPSPFPTITAIAGPRRAT